MFFETYYYTTLTKLDKVNVNQFVSNLSAMHSVLNNKKHHEWLEKILQKSCLNRNSGLNFSSELTAGPCGQDMYIHMHHGETRKG